jgi:hypothetical protein
MSTDLIAALRAALDAEFEIAQATANEDDDSWDAGDRNLSSAVIERESGAPVVHGSYDHLGWDTRRHIAAHDPAFVLADIAAKRKLIDLHAKSHPCPAFDQYPGGKPFVDPSPQWRSEPCATLRLLAEAYGIREGEQTA